MAGGLLLGLWGLWSVQIGCAAPDVSPDEPAGRDSAGVRIVENSGEDVALGWRFERRRSLGTASAGPEGFYQIDARSVAFDSAGRLLVLDKGNRRVVVFDSTGDFLLEFGHAGDAPDAFRFPRSIWASPDGAIEVLDTAHGAIKRFTPRGELEETRPVAALGLGMTGRVEATYRALVFDGIRGLRSSGDSMMAYLARVAGGDTVRLAEWKKRGTSRVEFSGCRVRYEFEPFFAPEIRWAAAGDRIAVNARFGYVVDIFVGGELARSVRRSIPPRRVTDADVRRAAEPLTRFRFGRTDAVCTKDMDELIRERGYEDERQLIADIAISAEGTVWVRRAPDPDAMDTDEVGPTDVFDPSGRYLGTLPPDAPFPISFAPHGEIVTKELDELDVEHLVFYRILERD